MSGSVRRKRDVIRRSEFSNKTQTLVHQDFNISQIDGKIKRFSKCENVNNIVKKPVYYTKNNRFKLLKRKTYLKNTYYIIYSQSLFVISIYQRKQKFINR